MKRLAHGATLSDQAETATADLMPIADGATVPCPQPSRFDYLFRELQVSDSDRLPEDGNTAQTLIDLGNSMSDPEPPFDSDIPSVYSYFGQFITHEIVLERTTSKTKLGPETVPLAKDAIPNLENARTPLLDLDSVYGPILSGDGKCYPVPVNGDEMAVERAGFSQVDGTDLPRELKPPFAARIGDGRNDANLVTSQMHLAFLRAHNALVQSESFNDACRLLRQHFQRLIVSDFLPRVVDDKVLESVRNGDFFNPPDDPPFMPVEFSAAAFRFGHSMPRARYIYNQSYKNVRLSNLFLPKGGYHHILEEWIIDWKQFLPGGANVTRCIDTRLVDPLSHLIDEQGKPVRLGLAALDLLRGYLLRLPTGQAVAATLGVQQLTRDEIESVAANPKQKAILQQSGLSRRTPLWYYILAEAAHFKKGLCLGPVGSNIVAKVLIGLVHRSKDSILHESNEASTIGTGSHFELADLFKLAGVL